MMSRASIGPKILLAATLSLVGGLLISNLALAATDSTGDAGNPAGQFNNETTQSNWTAGSPPAEPKTPPPPATSTTDTSTSTKSASADSARSTRRKLPSAVEMLRRFQKGGNPNEIMSSGDDSDTSSTGQDKDSSGKNLSPSLVHNFGPRGVLIPGSSAAAKGAAQDSGETPADDAVVNKEPVVAAESPEVVTAVHDAYAYLSKGKVEEALSTMAAAVRKEPRSMLARRASAFIMLYSGNARESVDQMFVLAALPNYQPQSFDRCTLGDAYLQLGRPDNALIAYEDALKINSENVQAKSGELRSMALVGRVEEAMSECVEAYKKAKQPPIQRYYRQLYVSLAEARAQLYTPPSDQGVGSGGSMSANQ
jgi:hypothetical protein